MAIVLVRIDDRLIHGQVVESWIPYLKATEIVVASEEAVADETRKTLMRLSLPEDVGLKVLGVSAAIAYLSENKESSKRILVLVPGPGEMLALVSAGLGIEAVNIGGLHYSTGKMQIGRAIFLSEEDSRNLKEIAAKGVKLEGRGVPSDKEMNLAQLLGT